MNNNVDISRYRKGDRVRGRLDEEDEGEVYCVTWKAHPDAPCIFARFKGVSNNPPVMHSFERLDLPNENSPNFNPYEPKIIGGRWNDLKIYFVKLDDGVNEDPVNVVVNAALPAAAHAALAALNPAAPRRRKTLNMRRRSRKNTRKARK